VKAAAATTSATTAGTIKLTYIDDTRDVLSRTRVNTTV